MCSDMVECFERGLLMMKNKLLPGRRGAPGFHTHQCRHQNRTNKRNFHSLLFLGLCCFLWSPTDARAQLWETPPLPTVKYAPAPDGMTVSVGAEQVHISVCRSAVIHFVATPDPSNAIRQNQPWMLDPKESCPGAKFQVSQTADAVILTTDTLKIEFSLKWGNVQYSTLAGETLLRERNPFLAPMNPSS